MARGWIWALVAAAGATAAGCAGKGGRTDRDGANNPPATPSDLLNLPPDEARRRYSDRLTQSALREQALEVLHAAAIDSDPQQRANALEALSSAPARVRPLLRRSVNDENAGVRAVSATIIGRGRFADMNDAARVLLNDESPYVRAAAIYALRRNGEPTDPNPLASMLLTDPSPRVRAYAAQILGDLGDRSAVGLLKSAAADPMRRANQAEVRLMQLQLAEAMVKLGEDSQLETIRAALYPARPEDLEASALAVQILGQVGDRGAVDQLVYVSGYRNEQGQFLPAEIRLAAAASLAKLGHTEGGFIADEYRANPSPSVRAQAAHVYGVTGRPENLARLEAMLSAPEGMVRVAAAAAVLRVVDRTGR